MGGVLREACAKRSVTPPPLQREATDATAPPMLGFERFVVRWTRRELQHYRGTKKVVFGAL